ncbi:putative translation initiation inhibitor, yjgF family [Acidovorax sp. CF316]|uniref:RidA family protein n=1 Tax=Acidovorax sp. CF316 TaxID=1144317 RepID=UPI00026BCABC|nr:RidA family protein [Acidovorax sp. CF316]EJE53760.1 putative translation initiation inhibitor, yjgF family [Acidovorax sp. CF316]
MNKHVPTTPEDRLAAAGLALPPAPQPRGSYAPCHVHAVAGQHWVAVSGQTSRIAGQALAGICEAGGDLQPARHAATVAMLNTLAALRTACGGELARVQHVVRLRGFVRSAPGFGAHPQVLDAASDVLAIAFPQQALPARSAIGVASLPDGVWIELEVDAVVDPA